MTARGGSRDDDPTGAATHSQVRMSLTMSDPDHSLRVSENENLSPLVFLHCSFGSVPGEP